MIRRLRAVRVCPLIKIYKRKIVERRRDEKKMQRYREDPDFAAKIKERNRKIYKKDTAKANRRRTLLRQMNKERTNEYARMYYKSNRERIHRCVYDARKRRDPLLGIHSAILAFNNGSGGFSEIIERIEAADKRINDKIVSVFSSERQAVND